MFSDIALQVSNVSKYYQIYDKPLDRLKQSVFRGRKQFYKEFKAIDNVSFDIRKGGTVGIIGRNGSGKSTLLQMLCGTLTPTSGCVEVFGRVAALLELGSGFNPEFTGRENIYLNASILGLSQTEIDECFDDIIAFADIGEFVEQPVKTYSSGMYLRLAFAVIAHVDADILVIDEALAVGDAIFVQKCMRFLRAFMKTGTVLFVSHDTASIKSLCTYAIWLDKGRIKQAGLPKDVCESYIEASYEAQQGKNKVKLNELRKVKPITNFNEKKIEPTAQTSTPTNIQSFAFDPHAAAFGKGGATIGDVYFLDENAKPLSWIVGGEIVTLIIEAQVHDKLDSPIIGFFIKDRLGQMLFGDNTSLAYRETSKACSVGDTLRATFVFNMPLLPAGDYSVAAAIANGTQQDHEQHHWIHDAIIFKSESNRVSNGLIGIPMLQLKLEVTHVE